MDAAGIEIGDSEVGVLGQLALNADARLHGVGRTEIRVVLILRAERAGAAASREASGWPEVSVGVGRGKAGWIGDGGLGLQDAIQAFLLLDERLRKAIIENPEARAKHNNGRPLPFRADAPRGAEPGSEVMLVAETVLRFVAQTVAQRDVRTK